MIIRYQCSKLFARPTCSVRKTGEITDGAGISLPCIRKTGEITDGACISLPCIRKIGEITDGACISLPCIRKIGEITDGAGILLPCIRKTTPETRMRSQISHVHPEIRTQIPDEIIDCNQVSFPAPFADSHLNLLIIRKRCSISESADDFWLTCNWLLIVSEESVADTSLHFVPFRMTGGVQIISVFFKNFLYPGGGQSAFLPLLLLRGLTDISVRDADRNDAYRRVMLGYIFRHCSVQSTDDSTVFHGYYNGVSATSLVDKVRIQRLYIPYIIYGRVPVCSGGFQNIGSLHSPV